MPSQRPRLRNNVQTVWSAAPRNSNTNSNHGRVNSLVLWPIRLLVVSWLPPFSAWPRKKPRSVQICRPIPSVWPRFGDAWRPMSAISACLRSIACFA